MATMTLEAKDLPGSESVTALGGGTTGCVLGLGLPSGGEKILMNIMVMGTVLGLTMLGAGSFILRRNRS